MNLDILKGKAEQIKGIIQKFWGEITNDEASKLAGDTSKITGFIQEKFGVEKEEIEKKLSGLNFDELLKGDALGNIKEKASDLFGKLTGK